MHLTDILDESAATPAFKNAVLALRDRTRGSLITSARPIPYIKLVRLITQLLDAERGLEIVSARVTAESGCSDLTGVVDVECVDGQRRFSFSWDCAWRAIEMGWTDCFGFPDQIRAAREFDWRCFKSWQSADDAPSISYASV
ncbi:MAG TPA: hypothetical protein VN717_10440 [Gemmatimonadaceae bacterium]|nr:hypothetical protein [Gemmatimonadaceae bacterium]